MSTEVTIDSLGKMLAAGKLSFEETPSDDTVDDSEARARVAEAELRAARAKAITKLLNDSDNSAQALKVAAEFLQPRRGKDNRDNRDTRKRD